MSGHITWYDEKTKKLRRTRVNTIWVRNTSESKGRDGKTRRALPDRSRRFSGEIHVGYGTHKGELTFVNFELHQPQTFDIKRQCYLKGALFGISGIFILAGILSCMAGF